jgi:hypothetical protein
MPLIRTNTGGAQIIGSAKVARYWRITVNAGAQSGPADTSLLVTNLPNHAWWVQQIAGPAGSTWQPQWAVDNIPFGGGVAPRWVAVTPAQVLPVAQPVYLSERLAANMIHMTITAPLAGAGTYAVILTSSM